MYIVRATQQIRSCMVMAAYVIREKRQVNAPRTVRKLALALNRLRLFLHPPRVPLEILGAYTCAAPSSKSFSHLFSDLASMKLSVALWLYEGVNPWSRTLMISGL